MKRLRWKSRSITTPTADRCRRPLFDAVLSLVFATVFMQAACGGTKTPTVPPLTHLDFRYDSRDHMAPSSRIVRVRGRSDEVHAMLLDELREADASEIREEKGLSRRIEITPDSEQVFERKRAIAALEWAAYETRDRTAFEAINRNALDAEDAVARLDPTTDGSLISARVWVRKARFIRTDIRYNGNQRRESKTENREPLASRIRFEIWSAKNQTSRGSETFVYVTAAPIVMQRTAQIGEELPLSWLEFVKGEDEARLVESYLRILSRW